MDWIHVTQGGTDAMYVHLMLRTYADCSCLFVHV
jgi:hypothetical protein